MASFSFVGWGERTEAEYPCESVWCHFHVHLVVAQCCWILDNVLQLVTGRCLWLGYLLQHSLQSFVGNVSGQRIELAVKCMTIEQVILFEEVQSLLVEDLQNWLQAVNTWQWSVVVTQAHKPLAEQAECCSTDYYLQLDVYLVQKSKFGWWKLIYFSVLWSHRIVSTTMTIIIWHLLI